MPDHEYDRVLERAETAEARCQELEEKLTDALLKLEKISDIMNPGERCPDSW